MGKRKHLVGVAAFIVLTGSLIYIGCNRDGKPGGSTPLGSHEWTNGSNGVSADTAGLPENSKYIGGPVGSPRFLTWDNSDGRLIIDQVAGSNVIRQYCEIIEAKGYSFAREYSYVIEGKDVPPGGVDSVAVRVVTLAFRSDTDSVRQAYFLSYADCLLGRFVAPWQISLAAPSPVEDWEQIADGVWSRSDVAMPLIDPRKDVQPTATWCSKCWRKCVIATSAGGCAACAVFCAWTAIAYPYCVGVCCTAQTIGALVKCTLEQVL